MATVLISPLVGCADHHGIYDPYYRDYHPWNDHETVYYQRWEVETRRDHVEFTRRAENDRKDYWTWRHNHDDHH